MIQDKSEKIEVDQENVSLIEKIIELDFKYFNFLICDYKDLRVVFILKDPASERYKNQTMAFLIELDSLTSRLLDKWDGSLREFDELIPDLLNKYLLLHLKDQFELNKQKIINKIIRERGVTTMETRIMNVIKSINRMKAKIKNVINFSISCALYKL